MVTLVIIVLYAGYDIPFVPVFFEHDMEFQ